MRAAQGVPFWSRTSARPVCVIAVSVSLRRISTVNTSGMSDTEKPLLRTLEKELQKLRNLPIRTHGWQASLLAFAVGCLFVMTSSALLSHSSNSRTAAIGSVGGLYAGLESNLLVAPRAATSNRRVLEDGSCSCSGSTAADLSAIPHVNRRILIFYHIFVSNQWLSVVEDQIAKLLYSGLYHEATAVICGIAGSSQVHAASAMSQADGCCASSTLASLLPGTIAPRRQEAIDGHVALMQEDIQQAANLLAAYGTKFDIGAAQVNSPLNERLTMNLIRERALPGDRVLCAAAASHDGSPPPPGLVPALADACWQGTFLLCRYMHTKGVSSRVQSWARNIFFWRSVMEYFLIARWRDCIDLLEQYDVVGVFPILLML